MDRSGNPTDAGEAFRRKMGRDPYPTPTELKEWERIHRRSYYNDDPIVSFEERMEATFTPSVNMLALKINGVDTKEHLAIFEWVKERLESLIHI